MTPPFRSGRTALASMMFLIFVMSLSTGQGSAQVIGNPEVSFGDHGVSQPVIEMREGMAANGPLHDKPLRLTHPNGAVRATQVVEWVNESFEVFSKATGAAVKGPIAGNQLFQALGATHPCAVNNDGDPIAQYDKFNNRWVLTQFSVTNGGTAGFFQCVAVSQTSDAT